MRDSISSIENSLIVPFKLIFPSYSSSERQAEQRSDMSGIVSSVNSTGFDSLGVLVVKKYENAGDFGT